MTREIQRTESALILYDGALVGKAGDALFDPEAWRFRERLVGEASGRGTAWFLRADEGEWVLRHYRRGGMIARLVHDSYVWTGLRRTRAFREWDLLDYLYRAGLPVPRPVAARVIRKGLCYRADIITQRLSGEPLSRRLGTQPPPLGAWETIGRTIRRLHDAGVWHADLNAHNILLAEGEVHLIDFDRARLRDDGEDWRQDNLARLGRSLRKLLGASFEQPNWQAGWRQLLDGYEKGSAGG
ncbi:MAG: 3-deoxy-D-manno-octulosonic acid kinase [Gammaproteobacteria bacterium]|jgi:3-deoxy-D-manno-octulosonic acid kinase